MSDKSVCVGDLNLSRGDEVKRIKRMSRRRVPRRVEQEIPLRGRDPRKARHAEREETLRAMEEEVLEEDLLEGGLPEEGKQ